jgi:maleate isomerase
LYGWRGRIGLLVASTNGVVEMEAFKMLPEGVSVHFTRVPYAGTGTPEAGRKMVENVESCAKLLSGSEETLGMDVIGFAHGSGSAVTSPSGKAVDIAEVISKAVGGTPAFTASTTVLDALKKLGARTISIGLPLNQPSMIKSVKDHLEANGLTIKKVGHLGLPNHHVVSSQFPEAGYRLMKDVYSSDVDAVVINNANIRTLEVINSFEKDFGKPVITANQSLMWKCLRTIGVHDGPKFGKLFDY